MPEPQAAEPLPLDLPRGDEDLIEVEQPVEQQILIYSKKAMMPYRKFMWQPSNDEFEVGVSRLDIMHKDTHEDVCNFLF